jgi:hypothetical protein
MTFVVLFTVLRCGLGACQVDLNFYTLGLTPLHCATVQAAVTIQVVTGTHVEYYGLPKVRKSP